MAIKKGKRDRGTGEEGQGNGGRGEQGNGFYVRHFPCSRFSLFPIYPIPLFPCSPVPLFPCSHVTTRAVELGVRSEIWLPGRLNKLSPKSHVQSAKSRRAKQTLDLGLIVFISHFSADSSHLALADFGRWTVCERNYNGFLAVVVFSCSKREPNVDRSRNNFRPL
jgi:hypothetical protein